jgi:hypothetical protein
MIRIYSPNSGNKWQQDGQFGAMKVKQSASRSSLGAETGGMAERSIAPVLKTGDPQGSVGSNPTPSAILVLNDR